MDPIEFEYDSVDAIPEAFRALYTEQNGKHVLTHVNGVKSQKDVLNVQEALRKERTDHAAAREALKPFTTLGKTFDEIQQVFDRLPELEAAASGKVDETKIAGLVTQRVAPLERKLTETTTQLQQIQQERDQLAQVLSRREMSDVVRAVAGDMKVLSTAVADVELFAQMALERQEDGTYITKSGIPGVTAGVDAKTMMKDLQKVRPHWWPASEGGGAGGSGGNFGGGDNPWSAKGWNITKQGEFIRANGMPAAQQAAKQAGSAVGATKAPAK